MGSCAAACLAAAFSRPEVFGKYSDVSVRVRVKARAFLRSRHLRTADGEAYERKRRKREESMKNLGKYMARYWYLYLFAVACLVIGILMDVAAPVVIERIIDDVVVGGQQELLLGLGLGLVVLACFSAVLFGGLSAQAVCTDQNSGMFWLCYLAGVAVILLVSWWLVPALVMQAVGGITLSMNGESITVGKILKQLEDVGISNILSGLFSNMMY